MFLADVRVPAGRSRYSMPEKNLRAAVCLSLHRVREKRRFSLVVSRCCLRSYAWQGNPAARVFASRWCERTYSDDFDVPPVFCVVCLGGNSRRKSLPPNNLDALNYPFYGRKPPSNNSKMLPDKDLRRRGARSGRWRVAGEAMTQVVSEQRLADAGSEGPELLVPKGYCNIRKNAT